MNQLHLIIALKLNKLHDSEDHIFLLNINILYKLSMTLTVYLLL